ncbi:hypothetical protein HDA41_000179 [Streptomyces caelestis]|uniref:Uncharacterized protein n=1 Tax=Streptomyces caelestis TaxID=36816 RepID=A0A7W9GY54_9ACTN|nr:hypothetical protein [Streptomyces caelestis]
MTVAITRTPVPEQADAPLAQLPTSEGRANPCPHGRCEINRS